MLMLSLGLQSGARTVLRAVAGIATASLLFLSVSALGLSALLAASDRMFQIVRLAGAAYLIYLGARTLWSSFNTRDRIPAGVHTSAQPVPIAAADPRQSSFWQGFATHIANPKAVLYWSALPPLFLDQRQPLPMQIAALGRSAGRQFFCGVGGYVGAGQRRPLASLRLTDSGAFIHMIQQVLMRFAIMQANRSVSY